MARTGVVGADSYWLVALGREIRASGMLGGVPFASAPTDGWHNLPVAAELMFAGLDAAGATGLLMAQIVAVALALILVAWDARSLGARDLGVAVVLLLVFLGSLPALGVVRLQLLSLVPFALLLLLLRAEHAAPSTRVWLLVPLFALWGNLHGAVLVGFAVAGSYLAFSRLRPQPVMALAVGAASFAALWLNPAGLDTWRYYVGVFGNEAARRGTELWARPSLHSGFDVLMLAGAALLVVLFFRRRRPLWEHVVVAGLVVGTALTARNGLWLLLFCAAPAAAHLLPTSVPSVQTWLGRTVLLPLGVVALAIGAGAVLGAHRTAEVMPVSAALTDAVLQEARGGTVLGPEPAVESFATAGVTVWVANPIDAFEPRDQAAYLDFLDGGPLAGEAIAKVDLVVVEADSALGRRMAGHARLSPVRDVEGWRLYRTTD